MFSLSGARRRAPILPCPIRDDGPYRDRANRIVSGNCATAAMAIDPAKLRDEADGTATIDHDAAWATEISERIRQVEAGEVKAVRWSEARRRIIASTALRPD